MDSIMSKGTRKEDLLSMSRVRGLVCAICVSNLVTTDRKYPEEFTTARTMSREHRSKYKFPKEALIQDDWTTWVQF